MAKTEETISKVAALISAAAKARLTQRIPGSFTTKEYAEQNDISEGHARKALGPLALKGVLKIVMVPFLRSDSRVMAQTGYILAEDLESFQKSQSQSKQRKTTKKN